ncbi:MAG TPA: hypothetical protein VIJ39_16050 [Solirubrobacteraceae bacterium]
MARMAFNLKRGACAALILAGTLALLAGSQASARSGVRDTLTTPPTDMPAYSATVEQCATSTVQAERSATFTAQMTATADTQRMGVRFELQQRLRGESEFHTVLAPGLGVWHSSEVGVQIYKYVKQVTNLDAPAAYRAIVHFRWLSDKGRMLKRSESRTSRCIQPALSSQVTQTPPVAPTPVAS